MNEISIQNQVLTSITPSVTTDKEMQTGDGNSFLGTLNDAISEVNKLHHEADGAVQELASGDEKDIHNTMIALEKAEISFQMMMQVRNKIITAYETIMRTSV